MTVPREIFLELKNNFKNKAPKDKYLKSEGVELEPRDPICANRAQIRHGS